MEKDRDDGAIFKFVDYKSESDGDPAMEYLTLYMPFEGPALLLFILSQVLIWGMCVYAVFLGRKRYRQIMRLPPVGVTYTFDIQRYSKYNRSKKFDYTAFEPGDTVTFCAQKVRRLNMRSLPVLGTVLAANSEIIKIKGRCRTHPKHGTLPDSARYDGRFLISNDTLFYLFSQKSSKRRSHNIAAHLINMDQN
ncbi:MAG: hypothetical protein FWE32_03335 [Oscillospiraceae bacterium]|nr:hypothetical protein [Oscillospiraceae bacterium]